MAQALIGAAAQAAGNTVSGIATSGMQILGNTLNNAQQNRYNDTVINRAETAFTDSGLPRYMAYTSGNNGVAPTQKFQLQGGNFYSAGPVNSNLPLFTNTLQQETHSASPRKVTNQSEGQSNSTWYVDLHGNVTGQTDRMGLGNGRYSGAEIAPPRTLYNSAGSQAVTPTRSFSSQATTQMNTRYAQTRVTLGSGISNIG